jgi:hypothetical protein
MLRKFLRMFQSKSSSEVVTEELVDALGELRDEIERSLSAERIATTPDFRRELYCFLCAVAHFWHMGRRSFLSDPDFAKQICFSLLRNFRREFSSAEKVREMFNSRIDEYSSLVPSTSLTTDAGNSGALVSGLSNRVAVDDWYLVGQGFTLHLMATTLEISQHMSAIEEQVRAGIAAERPSE